MNFIAEQCLGREDSACVAFLRWTARVNTQRAAWGDHVLVALPSGWHFQLMFGFHQFPVRFADCQQRERSSLGGARDTDRQTDASTSLLPWKRL